MELYNVIEKLKQIAEDNDSEDVARAIDITGAYTFKDRLKEAEDASIYSQGDISEGPGDDDDQYCAKCGNTGEDLANTGEPCPNCSDEEAEVDAFGRIHDRVEARDGIHKTDPWGIGEEGAKPDYIDIDGDGNTEEPMKKAAGEVDEDSSEDTGSALDRVIDRSHRTGDGGPISRVQDRHNERFAALEEEMGRVFNTPMERHSWIMNQLNDLAGHLSPEDAAMIKKLMKTAGEAEVKGGNC